MLEKDKSLYAKSKKIIKSKHPQGFDEYLRTKRVLHSIIFVESSEILVIKYILLLFLLNYEYSNL